MSGIKLQNADSCEDKAYKADLEKWLENAVVDNFGLVFDSKFRFLCRQYDTKDAGIIDILACEEATGDLVVIELKKDKETDIVVGQTSRYMGWVRSHIGHLVRELEGLQDGKKHKDVKGVIICGDTETKLVYAVDAHDNITLYCYYCDPVSNLFWLGRVMRLARSVNHTEREGKVEIGAVDKKPDYLKLIASG